MQAYFSFDEVVEENKDAIDAGRNFSFYVNRNSENRVQYQYTYTHCNRRFIYVTE